MGTSASLKPSRVVLFDGVCNLCNQSVLFIIQRDPSAKFHFATLQGAYAQQQLAHLTPEEQKFESVVLLQNGKIYRQSSAALEIARQLTGAWPLMYAFIVVPPIIRNAVYDWIARNRYKWFGKKDACMIPTPELKARFIE